MFTKLVTDLMTDDEYGEFQIALVRRPDMGAVIQGTGGLRKARWQLDGRGKRACTRFIYYWLDSKDQIYLLHCYPKSDQDDLTVPQKKILRDIVTRWLNEES